LNAAKYNQQRFDIAGKRGPEYLKLSSSPRVFRRPVSTFNKTLCPNCNLPYAEVELYPLVQLPESQFAY
jgi:hypothetical protein